MLDEEKLELLKLIKTNQENLEALCKLMEKQSEFMLKLMQNQIDHKSFMMELSNDFMGTRLQVETLLDSLEDE